jgi:DNA polymerase-3 subunit gamma/tau
MLLFDKVQVLGLDGSVLTLGFPDAGSVKAFVASGHDEVLRQSVLDIVGADWRIDAVHQPGATAAAAPSPAPPAPPARPAPKPAPRTRTSARTAATDAPADADRSAAVDDLGPDDPSEDDEALDAGVAGADLVARELGGRVIGEFDAS